MQRVHTHPGCEKNQSKPGNNSHSAYSTRPVITGNVPQELRTPRDRDGTLTNRACQLPKWD